ncbi:MAG: hypothetical protein HY282_09185 [Nitrospirae bacterium]|nr:hypothetical protein [Candidatus Manganitrophaceae bacterium]
MMERILTATLSTVLPGAGQMLQHRWVKGAIFLASAIILSGVVRRETLGKAGLLSLQAILVALALWSAVDAFQRTGKKK